VFGAATELMVRPAAGTWIARRRGFTLLLPAATPAATLKVKLALVRTGEGAAMVANSPDVVGACSKKGGTLLLAHIDAGQAQIDDV
jgi:hypothetical protein